MYSSFSTAKYYQHNQHLYQNGIGDTLAAIQAKHAQRDTVLKSLHIAIL